MPIQYLKKELQTNVPLKVLLKKRLPAKDELDFTTKEPTGMKNYPYIFILEGKEFWHFAKEYEQTTLENFKEGEEIEVCRIEKLMKDGKRIPIMQWGSEGSAEMKAQPQMKNNTTMIREEGQKADYDLEKKRKDRSIGLRGLMQAHISCGKANKEALVAALEADKMVEDYVNALKF